MSARVRGLKCGCASMKRIGFLFAPLVLLATACAPTPRFEWGGYEMALYRYHKQPAQREAYRTALRTAIERGRASNRVAPGLYAELGYLSLEDGDTTTAVTMFEEEMRLFPESGPLLRRVIEQIQQPSAPAATIVSEAEVQS